MKVFVYKTSDCIFKKNLQTREFKSLVHCINQLIKEQKESNDHHKGEFIVMKPEDCYMVEHYKDFDKKTKWAVEIYDDWRE